MKALKYTLAAAAVFALSMQAAAAASLGAVEFERITNGTYPMWVDLGGVNAARPDHTVTRNDYNGAVTLPGGLPADYSIHIDRTFIGDGNASTEDRIKDKWQFMIDPASMFGPTATADATLTLVTGYDTGMHSVNFKLFEADENGMPTGTGIGQIDGGGNLVLTDLSASSKYVLQVSGRLFSGANATNVGRYDIVLGLSTVPVPPAILLLLSGLGALFGFGGLRRKANAA